MVTNDDIIVPMPVGVTTYTDMDLQPGTNYYYRIRAVNACNDDAGDQDTLCGGTDNAVNQPPTEVVRLCSGEDRSHGSE